MSDTEVELIVRTIANNVRTYEQVVEVGLDSVVKLHIMLIKLVQLLAYLAPHGGGLLYLSFGLFHQQEVVRDLTVDIFNELRSYAVRSCLILSIYFIHKDTHDTQLLK